MATARVERATVEGRRARKGYRYREILAVSRRVAWELDDVLTEAEELDFSRPFLPEALAPTGELSDLLSPDERRTLNQIAGNAYLYTFGLVEELILPFVLDHARPRLRDDDYRVRALLQFASEEAKHIQLFKRFSRTFARGFAAPCEVIGPPEEVAAAVLGHHPLAVALLILHIEWMTQRHYVEGVQDDVELCPRFKSLLRNHWLEEAQHAKLDTLMVEAIAATCEPAELAEAIEQYLAIGAFLDAGLAQQTRFDVDALARVTGRAFTPAERERLEAVQHQGKRWTYLGSGMTHPELARTLARIYPEGLERVAALAPQFC